MGIGSRCSRCSSISQTKVESESSKSRVSRSLVAPASKLLKRAPMFVSQTVGESLVVLNAVALIYTLLLGESFN